MSPMISSPAARARATTGCGSGWVCGMPGDSTSEVSSERSAVRRSTIGTPFSSAARRFSSSSSQAQTSAPPRSSARAATSPDLPRPRTATGRPSKGKTSIIGAALSSPQLQGGEAGDREDRGDDPEADDDGRLLPSLLLEMMMERRHAEDALARQLEARHLDDH